MNAPSDLQENQTTCQKVQLVSERAIYFLCVISDGDKWGEINASKENQWVEEKHDLFVLWLHTEIDVKQENNNPLYMKEHIDY